MRHTCYKVQIKNNKLKRNTFVYVMKWFSVGGLTDYTEKYSLSDNLQTEVDCGPQWYVWFALPSFSVCICGGCGRNWGPWGQSEQSSQTRGEQVAIPVTRPFLNTSAPSEHGVNTFTAPLGNVRPMAGQCKSLWWQVTLAEGDTVCLGALPGHTGQVCGQTA